MPPFGFHQPQIFFNPVIARAQFPPPQAQVTTKPTPVTTVFVGNISEKCSNEFMQQMLQECGVVTNWKRIQGSNGKYQAFGFCDYEDPEGTLRALRVLNDFQIGEKKLVVKAEPKVREELRSWAIQQRKDEGKPDLTLKENELPADEDDLKKDEEVRLKILAWIDSDHPQLVTVAEDGELSDKDAKDSKKEEKKKDVDNRTKDSDRRRRISRSISRSRSRNEKRGRRSRSPKHKRRRHSSSRSSVSSRISSSSSSDSSRSRSRDRTPPKKKEREVLAGMQKICGILNDLISKVDSLNFMINHLTIQKSSEDSEDARERRALKKQIKEKEQAYMGRLKKWEARERQKAKQYEREERREKDRKRDILKEAKKLKHFLEDYDDEKDDPKYYKSSSLFQRKRDFEREREADSKDRLREQQEIEELKRQIVAENKDAENVEEEAKKRHQEQEEAVLRRLRADSGSPNPHQPLGQREGADSSSSSGESEDEEETQSQTEKNGDEDKWKSVERPSTPQSASPPVVRAVPSPATFPVKPDISQRLNGVFGLDDDDELGGKRPLRPFEITKEERMQTLTPDERRRMVRDLISNIPTSKDDLFAYTIDWAFVDQSLVEQRVRPWVAKKIQEFIVWRYLKLVMHGLFFVFFFRQAVCNMFSVPWHSIVFGRTDRGKPYLINPPRKFQFNISHQGDIIVLASSEGEPIGYILSSHDVSCLGVDVMRIDEERTSFWTHIQRMHKLFSSNELQMMKNQEDDKQRWTAFYRVWCLKESVLKATGTGLVNDLSSLDFTTSDEKHVPGIYLKHRFSSSFFDFIILLGCFITSTSWSQSSIPQPNWLFEESFVGDSHCVAVARILEPEFVEKERKLSQENSFNFITFEQLLNGSSVVNLMDDEATDQYSLFKLKPLKAI
uniref:L-aminoadipate-semialdehyde dehydrogenase-phosphopantetheinyl transferase n=1 Tax=Heterorhabditis bacteriophora TaxID=37862 RepID=A0A1I7XLF0_HETBA